MNDQTTRDDSYDELARRLCAAAISYNLGIKGIDYTLKNHVGEGPIGEYWVALARKVSHEMAENMGRALRPPSA